MIYHWFINLACHNQGNAHVKAVASPDNRDVLSEFLRPLASVQSIFATSQFATDDISYDAQFRQFLEVIYDPLTTSSDFKSAFTSIDDLKVFIDGLFETAQSLLAARKDFYDKDATSSVKHVLTSLKTIPELKPDDLSEYISAVRGVEKLLLQHCEVLSTIITSVEHDAAAFGCDERKICSIVNES